MKETLFQENKLIDTSIREKTFSRSFRILLPLYTTYIVFILSILFIFIPQQKKQLLHQKKETIVQLTENVISLLSELNLKIEHNTITPEKARQQAINQIRNLRYGPESKDYFWIIDMHAVMIMHPYSPDLEGRDLTQYKDAEGSYPFLAMVEKASQGDGGFVNYWWQWKDVPQKVVPKISYVKRFSAWNWVVGTGMYVDDIQQDIKTITQRFIPIFGGILAFILALSVYITNQVVKIEQAKQTAEKEKKLEELRLKKLFELSQMTEKPISTLTDFALEEAIHLTGSDIGYLAFLNGDESQLTMHTWSRKVMKQCEIDDKILVYNVEDAGLWAEAVRTRKVEIINDYANIDTPNKKGIPQGHVTISRVMNVPIFDADKIVVLAGVGNKQEAYNESDARQLQLMMDGMWKILQRKKAETELKKSEERYRLLADNATDTISVLKLSDFKYSYISPSIEHLLGYTPSELIDLHIGAHISQNSLDNVVKVISEERKRESDNSVDPKRSRVLELEMIKKNGSNVWVEITASFLRDTKGEPDRILAITRDVTHRKSLENELVKSNTDLQLAQRIARIGNVLLDPETPVPVWSDEVYRICERDLELGPLPLEEHKDELTPIGWNKFNAAIQTAIHDGRPFDIELNLLFPSGKEKWVNLIGEPEPERGPHGHFLRGTLQDITDRKRLELHIQQTQKMEALGTLAGGIAHDFNNILSAILGFTELAKLNVMGDEDTLSNLNQVLTAGVRARDLVKHILTFSRKSDTQKDRVQIVPLVKECLKFLKSTVSPNIQIQSHFIQTDCLVLADTTQMHQVLMNLFTNAVYAMREGGGILDVSLKSMDILDADIFDLKELKPGRYIQLTISDTGCGIPKRVIGKIFEPFFTTKVKGEGTGMGLSLTYGIIKEMHGHISVYSEPGMGTTFHILIPEQTGDIDKNEIVDTDYLVKGKGRILIVDDEIAITKWMSRLFIKLGYDVTSVNNGRDALDIFKQTPMAFDLIMTDLAMPNMTGLELSSFIRSERPDIPIILCTGFSEGLTSQAMSEYGISDMVMKPMIASELAHITSESLKKGCDRISV